MSFDWRCLSMSYNILIADDELDIVKMLAGFFSSKGYNTMTATNGIDTIKQAEKNLILFYSI